MLTLPRIATRRAAFATPLTVAALAAVNACGDISRGSALTDPATPVMETAAAPRDASINGSAPMPVESDDVVPGLCAFDIRLQTSGKSKMLVVGKAQSIVLMTSPGLNATLTNLSSPQKQVTLSITGAFHVTTDANGNSVYVVTGRNLLFDPVAGFVLTEGVFSYTLGPDGVTLVHPLSGKGKTTNVCALLS